LTFSKIRIYFKVQSRKIEKRGEKVFPNLEAEMARNKVTQVKLAEILGITPTTLSFKMNGKSTLSLKECVEIKRKAFPREVKKRIGPS
jgi:DNA-binding XRE family transcriptional regulator